MRKGSTRRDTFFRNQVPAFVSATGVTSRFSLDGGAAASTDGSGTAAPYASEPAGGGKLVVESAHGRLSSPELEALGKGVKACSRPESFWIASRSSMTYIEYIEAGLALDHLAYTLVEPAPPLSDQTCDANSAAGDRPGMDPCAWEQIRPSS